MEKGNLKNRKKNKSEKEKKQPEDRKKTTTKKDDATNSISDEEDAEKTLSQVFFEHPLVVVAKWVLTPYFLYVAYMYLRLERPDLLTPLGIHLRPAVAISETRQVLIVGSMSSGTVQVASDLSAHFKLEIGHESSDSQSEFVRDGTVSWIHVLRYLEPPAKQTDATTAYLNLCERFTPKMGFHPAMYRPSTKCSQRVQWDKCWMRECLAIVRQEWGCALPTTENQCETPFATVLHQTRHPVRTIESLVVKFCQGDKLETGIVSPEFLKFASALFGRSHNFTNDSCVEAAAHYVLQYNHAMIEAQSNFLINGVYRVEETSPCDVAKMAGFLVNDKNKKPVYPPSAEKVAKVCSSQGDSPAHQAMTSTEHKRNEGIVKLDWVDFRGGYHGSERPAGDTSLETELKDLTQKLGY